MPAKSYKEPTHSFYTVVMIFLNVCDILQAWREHSVTIQLRGKATAEFFCLDLFEMTANLFTVKATGFMHDLKPTINENKDTKSCLNWSDILTIFSSYSYRFFCFFFISQKQPDVFFCAETK